MLRSILKANGVEILNNQHNMMPLAIIHVSELQQMEQSLAHRKENIFNFLKHYHSITNPARVASEGNFILICTLNIFLQNTEDQHHNQNIS